jgi:hypothetical protein
VEEPDAVAAELRFAAATTKGFEELPPVTLCQAERDSAHYVMLFEEQEKEVELALLAR